MSDVRLSRKDGMVLLTAKVGGMNCMSKHRRQSTRGMKLENIEVAPAGGYAHI